MKDLKFQIPTFLLCIALASAAHADTLWVSSGGNARALEIPSVKIIRVENDKLVFQASTGRESSRDMAQISRMQLDDEPSLNTAEEAYAAQKYDVATDGYQKTVQSTTKAWLKEYVVIRLLDSATKSKRFDAAVTAYIAMILADPAKASKLKPALPDEKSTYLTSAATEISTALANAKLTADQQRGLLSFLLDIQRAKKDSKAAADTMQQLLKLDGGTAADTATAAAMGKVKLDGVASLVEAKDFQKALAEIQASKTLFTDPHDQAQALFLTAQATEGLAGENANAQQLKDVALAYMRVVAHFKDVQGAPYVPDALLKVAAIHERLKEPETALSLYQQVSTQYQSTPAGPKATEAVNRLKAKSG